VNRTLVALALAATSFTASAQATRPPKAGDVSVYSGEQRTDHVRFEETITVTTVDGEQIRTQHVRTDRAAPSEGVYTRDWSTLRSGGSGSSYEPAVRVLPQPLEVGKASESVVQAKGASGALSRVKLESTVAAREKLATAAGEFDTYRIESKGYISGLSWQGGFAFTQKLWYAPAIDRLVRQEYKEQRTLGADNVWELKSFKPAD
jgi:hypothetical protein